MEAGAPGFSPAFSYFVGLGEEPVCFQKQFLRPVFLHNHPPTHPERMATWLVTVDAGCLQIQEMWVSELFSLGWVSVQADMVTTKASGSPYGVCGG
jgi:hypothetical protein